MPINPFQFQRVMKMHRKTIEISYIISKGNEFFLHSADDMEFERRSLMGFITDILHETGNYNGFRYLSAKDMKKSYHGTSVGINFDENGNPNFTDSDESRIRIFKSKTDNA